MKTPVITCSIMTCLTLQACSSRPREFAPKFALTAVSQNEVGAIYATCQQLFVEGKLDSDGRAGSAGAGAAVGVGTAAAGGAAAAAAGPWAGAAVASATVVLLPVAILGGAWGMSRMKRANKERAIKRAMSGCMADRGFQIAGWAKTGKKVAVFPKR
jgi:hypothetical protein